MNGERVSISVLIATADRPDELAATLRSLAACRIPNVEFEVLVADNGADSRTELTCREADAALNVRHLDIPRRGKTIALNQAIEQARGALIVFTDDDVEFDPGWLTALWKASLDHPAQALFGGRVTPLWPDGCPAHLTDSRHLGPLYALLDRGDEEGPLPGFRPFGPNMAVRRLAFEGDLEFDEAIGPGSSLGVLMGDETGIARQLEAQGQTAVYVPTAKVYHHVRKQQLALRWQLNRGMLYGRMLAHYEHSAGTYSSLGIPPWIVRSVLDSLVSAGWHAARGRKRAAFDQLVDAAVTAGRARRVRSHGR